MTEMIIWLVLLIVAIVAEVLTMGLTTIWFAGGALVAIFAAILNAPVWLQVVLFLVVSAICLIATRPLKYFNKDRIKTNAESLVGRQAIVTAEIDNLQGIGQVTVGTQEWSARSYDNGVRIPVGTVVDVLAINGVKLMVRVNAQVGNVGSVKNSIPEPMSVSQMEEMESSQNQ